MPAAPRLHRLVLILIPGESVEPRAALVAGRMACRAAVGQSLHPVYPPLTYGVFMPEEAMGSHQVQAITKWWHRRSSLIWLCFPPADTEPRLDPLTYEILMSNEAKAFVPRSHSDKSRIPVYLISWPRQDACHVELLSRPEVRALLRRNIETGMLGRSLP